MSRYKAILMDKKPKRGVYDFRYFQTDRLLSADLGPGRADEFAPVVRAPASSPSSSKSGWDQFKDFLVGSGRFASRSASEIAKVAAPLMPIARAYGFAIPGDSDIASYQAKIDGLRSLTYQAVSLKDKIVDRILQNKSADLSNQAQALSNGFALIASRANAAQAAMSATIDAVNAAQSAVARGGDVISATAMYASKKRSADALYTPARDSLQTFIANANSLQSRSAGQPASQSFSSNMIQNLPVAVGGAVGQAGAYVMDFATASKQAVEGGIKALTTGSGIVQYLPYMLVGLGGYWVWTQLPKAHKNPFGKRGKKGRRGYRGAATYAALGAAGLVAYNAYDPGYARFANWAFYGKPYGAITKDIQVVKRAPQGAKSVQSTETGA